MTAERKQLLMIGGAGAVGVIALVVLLRFKGLPNILSAFDGLDGTGDKYPAVSFNVPQVSFPELQLPAKRIPTSIEPLDPAEVPTGLPDAETKQGCGCHPLPCKDVGYTIGDMPGGVFFHAVSGYLGYDYTDEQYWIK